MATESVMVPTEELSLMGREIKALRNTALYKRLLQFTDNIKKKKFTRQDLGF
tara:strand:- start:1852 stop:2007 length:156 start_codon:yes stop_codon:yes gene_type:complete